MERKNLETYFRFPEQLEEIFNKQSEWIIKASSFGGINIHWEDFFFSEALILH